MDRQRPGNTEPPPTTVQLPAEAIGRHMARPHLSFGGQPVDQRAVILVPDLVVRDSS